MAPCGRGARGPAARATGTARPRSAALPRASPSVQSRDDALEQRARLQADLGLAEHAVVELEGLAVGPERRRRQPALDDDDRAGQRHAVAEPVAQEPRARLG